MSANISKAMLAELHQKAERAYAAAQGAKDKANETFHAISRTMLTGGTAFAIGMSDGYFGEKRLGNVSMDGAVATAGTIAAFLGLGGRNARHVHSIANGALAVYMTKLGLGYGEQWAAKSSVDAAGAAIKDVFGL